MDSAERFQQAFCVLWMRLRIDRHCGDGDGMDGGGKPETAGAGDACGLMLAIQALSRIGKDAHPQPFLVQEASAGVHGSLCGRQPLPHDGHASGSVFQSHTRSSAQCASNGNKRYPAGLRAITPCTIPSCANIHPQGATGYEAGIWSERISAIIFRLGRDF